MRISRRSAGVAAFVSGLFVVGKAGAADCDLAQSTAHVQNAIQAATNYFATYGAMPDKTKFPARFAKNELDGIEEATVKADCIVQKGQPMVGALFKSQLQALKVRLLVHWSDLVAFEAVKDARYAEADAKAASTLDDAKAALGNAKKQAVVLREQQRFHSSKYMRDSALKIGDAIVGAQREVDLINSGPNSICGAKDNGRPKESCGTFGLYAASLSYIWIWTSADTVTARPRLASVAVPSASYRLRLVDWLAADFGGYSAFLTKSLTATSPTVAKAPCSKSPTEYENRLPCEANPDAFPYFAAFAGITAGRDGVGFLTVAPLNVGLTQVGSRSKLNLFYGLTLGVVQVNGSF